MAITLDELKNGIESLELRCQSVEQLNAIMLGFRLDEASTYRDRDGDACLAIVFRLSEHGECLSAFVPDCWNLGETPHRAAVAMVLLAVMSKFAFVRFDLAGNVVVANVEVAVEDGTLTARQVQRIIGALLQAVQKFDVVIRRAIETGKVMAEDVETAAEADEEPQHDEDVPTEESSGHHGNSLARLLEVMDEGAESVVERSRL